MTMNLRCNAFVLLAFVSMLACTFACGGVVVEEVPARQPVAHPAPTRRVVVVSATPLTPSRRQYTQVPAVVAAPSRPATPAANQAADAQLDPAIVGDCREPKATTSCDSLRTWYLSTAPRPRDLGDTDSTRTYQQVQLEKKRQDAKQILDAAAPALRALAEADLWTHVDLPRCSAAVDSGDCVSTNEYVRRFPDGPHFAEAQTVLDAAQKRFAAKALQEQQKADAEQRAAGRRQQQANCKAACSTTTCVMYTTEDKKAQCVAQCVEGCH
jgi:hypothetical protein